MAEEHVKALLESNPNPTLEEEAAALDAPPSPPVEENTPAIPEKFIRDGKPDYEALAKAYAELEKKQGGKKDEETTKEEAPAPDDEGTADDDGEGDDKGDEGASDEDTARKVAESAGLDFDALAQEYYDTGELADASYKAFEAKGIPRHLVDGFIAGQEAIQRETTNTVYAEVGGKEAYDGMLSWASENLSKEEIEAFDSTINSRNMNQISLAVKGLKARYQAAEGVEPTVNLGGTSSKGGDVFKSWAQVQKAMSDPRYGSDPAYVAEIEAKLSRSGELI